MPPIHCYKNRASPVGPPPARLAPFFEAIPPVPPPDPPIKHILMPLLLAHISSNFHHASSIFHHTSSIFHHASSKFDHVRGKKPRVSSKFDHVRGKKPCVSSKFDHMRAKKHLARHRNLIIENVLNLSRDQNLFTRIPFLVARQRIGFDGAPVRLFTAFENVAGQSPRPFYPPPHRTRGQCLIDLLFFPFLCRTESNPTYG